MFRQRDLRRLPYRGLISTGGPVITRKCDACGVETSDLIPIIPAQSVPGKVEIPPFVCENFRDCVRRFQRERR